MRKGFHYAVGIALLSGVAGFVLPGQAQSPAPADSNAAGGSAAPIEQSVLPSAAGNATAGVDQEAATTEPATTDAQAPASTASDAPTPPDGATDPTATTSVNADSTVAPSSEAPAAVATQPAEAAPATVATQPAEPARAAQNRANRPQPAKLAAKQLDRVNADAKSGATLDTKVKKTTSKAGGNSSTGFGLKY